MLLAAESDSVCEHRFAMLWQRLNDEMKCRYVCVICEELEYCRIFTDRAEEPATDVVIIGE